MLELPIDKVDFCFKNPISGCRDPWKAAHGRVAEPLLIQWASAKVGLPWVEEPELSSMPWPDMVANVIRENHDIKAGRHFNYACDGCLGSEIAEVKLETDGPVKLAISQLELLQACRASGIPYNLVLGTLIREATDKQPAVVAPIGIVDLCSGSYLNGYEVLVSRVRAVV